MAADYPRACRGSPATFPPRRMAHASARWQSAVDRCGTSSRRKDRPGRAAPAADAPADRHLRHADEFAFMRFGASVFIVAGEKTFHPRNTAAEKTGRGPVAQMCKRIVDENINCAGHDIVGR